MKTMIAIGLAAALLVPLGMAGSEILALEVGDDTYYVAESGLWQESNGCDGLQEEPVNCRGDEELEPADDQL